MDVAVHSRSMMIHQESQETRERTSFPIGWHTVCHEEVVYQGEEKKKEGAFWSHKEGENITFLWLHNYLPHEK